MLHRIAGFVFIAVFIISGCAEESGQVRTEGVPPKVVSFNPPDGKTQVERDVPVRVEFSEKIPPATVRRERFSVVIAKADSSELGSYDVQGSTARFVPRDTLLNQITKYRVTVKNIADMHGNKMQDSVQWTFTTEDVPPQVESVEPADSANDVALDAEVTIEFSELIANSTINSQNIQLVHSMSNTQVSGSFSTENRVVTTTTFTPSDDTLRNNADYELSISTSVTDTAGHGLPQPVNTMFTTTDTTSS